MTNAAIEVILALSEMTLYLLTGEVGEGPIVKLAIELWLDHAALHVVPTLKHHVVASPPYQYLSWHARVQLSDILLQRGWSYSKTVCEGPASAGLSALHVGHVDGLFVASTAQ